MEFQAFSLVLRTQVVSEQPYLLFHMDAVSCIPTFDISCREAQVMSKNIGKNQQRLPKLRP